MTQSNPFSTFQSDPFFQFNNDFFNSQVGPVRNIDSPFGFLLEEAPEIPFQGALQRANLSPNLLRMFEGQRSNLFNQFQGLLDQQIRQGMIPNLQFGDFMGNFDFGREAFRTPPGERIGGGTSRFAPRTQFLR
jgi:hypothetical protein